MSIPIEEKHKYETSVSSLEYNDLEPDSYGKKISLIPFNGSFSTGGISAYYSGARSNFKTLLSGNDLSLSVGTADNQMIGQKVMLKNISVLINVSLSHAAFKFFNSKEWDSTLFQNVTTNYETLLPVFKDETDNASKFKFRLMLVRFDDKTYDDSDIMTWFNTIYVPQYYKSSAGTPVVTNQSKMLRESTALTGKFQILENRSFTINSKKGHKFIKFDLNPKTNLTFDNSGKPTDDKYLGLRLILFGPTYLKSDMNGTGFYKFAEYLDAITGQTNYNNLSHPILDAFNVQTNIKYTYYDL